MDERARQAYLQSQVMNASPEKLQWLLLDGALRYATQAENAWLAGENERASESLDRCRQIVAEMLSAIRPDAGEVAQRVLGLYVWVYRTLAEAQLLRDAPRLAEVIRILRIERETWQQVCEQDSEAAVPQAEAHSAAAPISYESGPLTESPGISFEA